MNLNEAQAYSNYKEAINRLGKDSDQVKPIVAGKKMREIYESSSKTNLYFSGIQLAHKINQLNSKIQSTKLIINQNIKDREWYLKNYPR